MANECLKHHLCTELYYSTLLFCLYPFRNKIYKIILLAIYTLAMTMVHSIVWYKYLISKNYKEIDVFDFSAVTVLITTTFSLTTIVAWKCQLAVKHWKFLIKALSKYPGSNGGRVIWYSIIILFVIASNIHIHYGMIINPRRFSNTEGMWLVYIGVIINILFVSRILNAIEAKVAEIKQKLQAEIETHNRIIALKLERSDTFRIYLSVSNINEILASFLSILRGIQSFNEIFGVTIVGLAILATMSIANTMYSVFINHIQMETYFKHFLLIKKVVDNVGFLVYCFLYIQPCVKIISHLDESVKLTCRLATKLSHHAANPNYSLLDRKLDLLSKQLTLCKPYFSAGDFFDVDYAIFLYIFAGISSIVVVYAQLM